MGRDFTWARRGSSDGGPSLGRENVSCFPRTWSAIPVSSQWPFCSFWGRDVFNVFICCGNTRSLSLVSSVDLGVNYSFHCISVLYSREPCSNCPIQSNWLQLTWVRLVTT